MKQDLDKQECFLLNTFSLHKTKLIVDKYHEQYCLAVQPQEQNNKNSTQMIANVVEISFTLAINQTLNKCLKEEAHLLQIWNKSHKVQLILSTKEGEYCFEEMNYFMFLNVSTNKIVDHIFLQILKVDYSLKRTEISMKIIIHRQGNAFQQSIKTKEIVISFGTKMKKQNLLSQLYNFKYQTKHSTVRMNIQPSPILNKFKFIDKQASSPIGIFNHQNQIYQSMGITTNGTVQQIEQLIKRIDEYNSPMLQKQNKVFLCHDMRGGYKQDTNFESNMMPILKPQNIAYRTLHIEQSQIFNYFSHYNITIPPKHWMILCRKYGTKCIGTFITQREDFDQNVLNSREFALFLIGVAKKCKFDGYLINIQRKIQNITFFKKWIEYLTNKMHQYIPNSLVIWYDSILPKDGTISYQNGLTRENYQFYHLTDGIFTNYWWQLENLKVSQQLRGTNKRKVYIGNDCFGRNTYGGGGFDLYKAANAILQYKNQLSIALFAPGFTYQRGGQYNRQVFHLNQMSMYKGIYSQVIVLDKWKESKKNNYSFGWEKQQEWTVSSNHKTNHCQRSVNMGFPKLQPNQSIKVTSTPPMFDSPYKIILQLIDSQGTIIKETDVYNFNNFKKSTNEVQLIKQEIDGSYQMIGDKQVGIKIIIMAKSRENWAGFYGPRFRKQCVNFLIYQKERHWTSKIPINQVIIGSSFHSYCNTGVGDFFHNEGMRMQPFYNFLADMDVPHTHIINHPLDTDFSYENAFCGASSLVVRKQVIKLLRVLIPDDINLQEEYYIQVTVKDTQSINLVFKYLSKNEEDRIFTAKLFKIEDVNDWKRYTFKLITNLIQANSSIRSIVEISSLKTPYFIGEIKLIKGKKKQSQLIKGSLSVSKGMVPSAHFFFNLTILSKTYSRLFVIIGRICMFAYFENGEAILKNIPVKKCEQFQIQIIDTDQSLENNILVFKTLSSASICELIFTGTTAL